DGVAASPPTRVDEILAVAVDNAARYRAGPLNAPVTLVWSTGEHYAHQQIESAKWYGLEVEHLDERLVEGSHHGIMREPEVAGLAAVIAAAVDDAVARTS
ncbi:MAG: hypothetical protein ACRDV0_03925, partial [Acidimicrobiales bacterium]